MGFILATLREMAWNCTTKLEVYQRLLEDAKGTHRVPYVCSTRCPFPAAKCKRVAINSVVCPVACASFNQLHAIAPYPRGSLNGPARCKAVPLNVFFIVPPNISYGVTLGFRDRAVQ